jgi:hypothetical protein
MVRELEPGIVGNSKAYPSMTHNAIFVFAAIGLLLLFVFLKIAMQGLPKAEPSSPSILATGQIVSLHGLSFEGTQRLLEPTEYQLLKSTPGLSKVAKSFQKERKGLVLLWIALLLEDVHNLWRFRRFLVRSGARSTLGEEMNVFITALLAITSLNCLRALVFMFGPLALSGSARSIRSLVEKVSYGSAIVLERLPPNLWPEMERTWLNSPG